LLSRFVGDTEETQTDERQLPARAGHPPATIRPRPASEVSVAAE
jgi:hypothetical protein